MFIDTKTMHKNLIWLSAVIFIISLNTCEGKQIENLLFVLVYTQH